MKRNLTVEEQAVRNAVDDAKCAACGGLRYSLTLTTTLYLRRGEQLYSCRCHQSPRVSVTFGGGVHAPERTPADRALREREP